MSSRLGKGLGELFNENYFADQIMENESSLNIELKDVIANPYQPRKVFELQQLEELRDSILEHGVITPIIVVFKDNQYVIVAGERRTRAAKMAGLHVIPAIIRDYTVEQMMEIALLENIQREDLTPIEIAQSYHGIITHMNITQDELAKRIGKSRSQVTNMLGLLVLPKEVQDLVNKLEISMGHARVLSKLDSSEKMVDLAKRIVKEKLTVRDVEAIARTEQKRTPMKPTKELFDYSMYQEILAKKFGTKVSVKPGHITIKFKDLDALEGIIEKLNG